MFGLDTATSFAVGLFALTAVLLILAIRAGQNRLGRILALSSIASVSAANYSMVSAYNGEPPLVYERPGPIERRVIQRRGEFEYVDKEGGENEGGSGQASAGGPASGGGSDGGSGDAGSNAASGSGTASRSALASLFSNVSNSAARDGRVQLGDAIKDCADCPDLVAVAPGFFAMGAVPGDTDASDAERPRRMVTVPRWFAIGRNEVSLGQYQAFAKATGRAAPDCGTGARSSDLAAPVTCVTFADARAYIEWLSRSSGIPYRLPAETEWEWAARGGNESRYVTGVGPPLAPSVTNTIGMAGLHGGGAELVGACWTATHADMSRAATRSGVDTRCRATVVRDAASGEPPVLSRLSARRQFSADQRSPFVGFRIARDL